MIAINPEYYEAASLDGANAWQKIEQTEEGPIDQQERAC